MCVCVSVSTCVCVGACVCVCGRVRVRVRTRARVRGTISDGDVETSWIRAQGTMRNALSIALDFAETDPASVAASSSSNRASQ